MNLNAISRTQQLEATVRRLREIHNQLIAQITEGLAVAYLVETNKDSDKASAIPFVKRKLSGLMRKLKHLSAEYDAVVRAAAKTEQD